jgi:flavin reductase (DIM6/NTAB) family NADH-FMN oxidoreductase RutF
MVLDQQTFRSAWRKFVTGVTVITTIENGGAVHGMAANGIASVSLDPLLVLIKSSGRFAINILSDRQEAAAKYYGAPSEKRNGDPGIEFAFTGNGSAVLPGCLAYMDCHVEGQHEAGDHTLFIAGVDELEVNPGRPLLFYEGGFHRIEEPSE